MSVIFTVPDFKFSDFWIGSFAKFTDKGLCVSSEFRRSELLAKSPVRMTN